MTEKLEISSNGHYLEKDGDPFLYIGETIWYMAQRTTRANVDTLLDGLDGTTDSAKGCTNVIQLAAVMANTTFSIPQNPTNVYGHAAFNHTAGVPDFADPLVVSGGSPDDPNDYWDHLDYIVREVDARDMHLMICPMWAKAWLRDAWSWGWTEVPAADCKSYGEFLGDRYKNYNNIMWLLGGDGTDPSTTGHVTHYRSLAEGIVKGVTGQTLTYNQISSYWDDALMTYHGSVDAHASDYWSTTTDKWCTLNAAYRGRHYTLKPAYELASPRPIMESEGYGLIDMSENQIKDARGHQYVHWLQGGRGVQYLNDYIWKIDGIWTTRLAVDERKQFVILKDIISNVKWWNLIPDNTIILSSNDPSEVDFKQKMVASKSSDGDIILIYFHHLSPKTSQINLNDITTNDDVVGMWIHPKDGSAQLCGNYSIDDNPTVTVPAAWEDGLLKLIGSSKYSRSRGISIPKPRYNATLGRFI